MTRLSLEVNGTPYVRDVEPRLLLVDFLRDHLQLTGTHIGCEHGVCGTCTVQIDGKPARSCLALAAQVEGSAIRTVESLASPDRDSLHPLQSAFHEHHALQCGYCTPGFLMSIEPVLPELRGASDRQVREYLSGSLCRCTGYQNIVEATHTAVSALAAESGAAPERRLTLELELPLRHAGASVWDALADPRELLERLGVAPLAVSGPATWRGSMRAQAMTIEGVLELIDVDEDRGLANFVAEGREGTGPGQVRAAVTLSVETSTLAMRAELEFIGIANAPSGTVLEERLRAGTAAWVASLRAAQPAEREITIAPRRGPRARDVGLGLVIATAGWLGWRALRRSR